MKNNKEDRHHCIRFDVNLRLVHMEIRKVDCIMTVKETRLHPFKKNEASHGNTMLLASIIP